MSYFTSCGFLTLFLSTFSGVILASESTAAAGSLGAQGLNQTIMLVMLFVVFYFMLIRPQSKRAKAHQLLIKQLTQGDEVVTSGGLMGRVVRLTDDVVVLMLAEGIEVKVQRGAIAQALVKGTIKSFN